MRDQKTPIELLVPIQYEGLIKLTIEEMQNSPKPSNDPIIIMTYKDKFLIGDGHHRSYDVLLRGLPGIASEVLETDEDVSNCDEGAFYHHDTIKSFIDFYIRECLPFLKKSKIATLRDYDNHLLNEAEALAAQFRAGIINEIMGRPT